MVSRKNVLSWQRTFTSLVMQFSDRLKQDSVCNRFTAYCTLIVYSLLYGRPIRRKNRQIERNAKCRYLKKFTCKGTLQQVEICFGVVKQFCRCSAQTRIEVGHLRKPQELNWFPAVESHLGVRAPYATRRKRRYEANKCGWTQPLFSKARHRGVN